jgi:hypothetical protein
MFGVGGGEWKGGFGLRRLREVEADYLAGLGMRGTLGGYWFFFFWAEVKRFCVAGGG